MAKRTHIRMRERLENWRNIIDEATLGISVGLLEQHQIETKKMIRKLKKTQKSMLNSRVKTQQEREGTRKGCEFCHRSGHKVSECWRRLGACLRCGNRDHKIRDCPRMSSRDPREKSQVEEEAQGTARQPGEPSDV